MKTVMMSQQTATHRWYLVDADGKVLGRLATRLATILMGKHKPTYTPHVDTGDNLVVINAEKVKLTGQKAAKKKYQTFSGFASGRREIDFSHMLQRRPEAIVRLAVKRMMPVSRLGKVMLRKLHVYAGTRHPHEGQKPEALTL